MFGYFQSILSDVLSLLLLSINIIKITSSSSITINDVNNNYGKQIDEYIMTSAIIDGIKRSNVCGDGYRIEGALLKSYPYSKRESYLPYENCYMTFQARRLDNQIRIRILTLDLNDIHGGVNCLDSLRFYKSAYLKRQDKLDSLECGQLTEAENFSFVSSTGIVTAHFSTDGGNVSGLGFKVVLTAFRYPNKTHPCDPNDDEFLCNNNECISSLLLCDGIAHCLDASDEFSSYCNSNIGESTNNNMNSNNRKIFNKHQYWRGISIIIFLLLIFIAFTIFIIYFIYRRFVQPPMSLLNQHENKNYLTIVNSPLNGPKTEVILSNRKRLDDDYNLI